MPETEVLTGKRKRKAAQKRHDKPETPPASPEPPAEAEEPPPEPRRGKRRDGIPKVIEFFDRCSRFPKEDWGTRIRVKVYRLKPVTDMVVATGHKYCVIYNTYPPPDEEQIKHDCGSGKYRLYLNYKAPAEGEKELDSTEIDILDMRYPPLLPKGAWLDDPRNNDWTWAKKVYEEQERRAKEAEETARETKSPDVRKYITDALDLADRMRGEKPSATDDLANLVTVAEKLRPPETIPQFLTLQFQALQHQAEASNKRFDELLMKMLDRTNKQESNGGIKAVVESIKELEPLIEKFLPGLASKAGDVLTGGRGGTRMSGWQEFVLGLAPQIQETFKPFSMLFAELIAARAMQQQNAARNGGSIPAALPPGQPAPNPAPDPNANSVIGFLGMLTTPMLAKIRLAAPSEEGEPIDPSELGDEFGSWVLEGYGVDPQYPGALQMAKTLGPAGIIAQFRSVPRIWNDKGRDGKQPSLAELEPKLTAFFTSFLNYKPPEAEEPESEDEPEQTDLAQPAVVDFDREYANA